MSIKDIRKSIELMEGWNDHLGAPGADNPDVKAAEAFMNGDYIYLADACEAFGANEENAADYCFDEGVNPYEDLELHKRPYAAEKAADAADKAADARYESVELDEYNADDVENIVYSRAGRPGQNKVMSIIQNVIDNRKDDNRLAYNKSTIHKNLEKAGFDSADISEIESIFSHAQEIAHRKIIGNNAARNKDNFGGQLMPGFNDKLNDLTLKLFRQELGKMNLEPNEVSHPKYGRTHASEAIELDEYKENEFNRGPDMYADRAKSFEPNQMVNALVAALNEHGHTEEIHDIILMVAGEYNSDEHTLRAEFEDEMLQTPEDFINSRLAAESETNMNDLDRLIELAGGQIAAVREGEVKTVLEGSCDKCGADTEGDEYYCAKCKPNADKYEGDPIDEERDWGSEKLAKSAIAKLLTYVEQGQLPEVYDSVNDWLYDFYPDLPWNIAAQKESIKIILASPELQKIQEFFQSKYKFDFVQELNKALNANYSDEVVDESDDAVTRGIVASNKAKSDFYRARQDDVEDLSQEAYMEYSPGDSVVINGISCVLEKDDEGWWAVSNNAEHEFEFEPGMEDAHHPKDDVEDLSQEAYMEYSPGDSVVINGISCVLEKDDEGWWAVSNNAEHEFEFEPGMEDAHHPVAENKQIEETNPMRNIIDSITLGEAEELDEDIGNLEQINPALQRAFGSYGKNRVGDKVGPASEIMDIEYKNASQAYRDLISGAAAGLIAIVDDYEVVAIFGRPDISYRHKGGFNYAIDREWLNHNLPGRLSAEIDSYKTSASHRGNQADETTVTNILRNLQADAKAAGLKLSAKVVNVDKERAKKQTQRAQNKPINFQSHEFERQARAALRIRLDKFKAANADSVDSVEDLVPFVTEKGYVDKIKVGDHVYSYYDDSISMRSLRGDSFYGKPSITYEIDDSTPEYKALSRQVWDEKDEDKRDELRRTIMPPTKLKITLELKGGTIVPTNVEVEHRGY